jgi:phosphoribosyl 1,2-cyclic phosphate phosphodiesterase
MSGHLKITVLGCGDSAGVPRIGGDWGDCDPTDLRNRRTRPSLMVQSDTTTLVVDTGPDFGIQLTREHIKTIDGVLYTHAHSDHVAGMDELRILQGRSNGVLLPIYADHLTLDELKKRFGYMFEQISKFYPAVVDTHLFTENDFGKVHRAGDIDFIPFVQDHGQGNTSLGFRFGDVGYSTDMINLDDMALSVLKGVKTWIADCADFAHGHGTLHSTFPNVLRLNDIIGAQQVYLTHLKMFYDYTKMSQELPPGYAPAYDGLVITSTCTA